MSEEDFWSLLDDTHCFVTAQILVEIVGFRRVWTEFFDLLGYYAVWGGFKAIFKGQANSEAWTLKMGPIGGPETSVSNHPTPPSNSEDGRIKRF